MSRPLASIDAVNDGEASMEMSDDVVLVGSATPVHAIAVDVVRALQAGRTPKMRATGVGAIGQATKAQAIARGIAAPLGVDLVYVPWSDNIEAEDVVVTWRVLWR